MGRHITPIVEESNKAEWRKRQLDLHGHKCRYCGTTENVEIHHIVPKNQGGDNRDSNIILLCRECHAKAHNKQQRVYEYKAGRKKLIKPDDFDELAHLYLYRKIQLKEILTILQVGKNTFYLWLDEYKERTGETMTHTDKVLGRNSGLSRQEYMKKYRELKRA